MLDSESSIGGRSEDLAIVRITEGASGRQGQESRWKFSIETLSPANVVVCGTTSNLLRKKAIV